MIKNVIKLGAGAVTLYLTSYCAAEWLVKTHLQENAVQNPIKYYETRTNIKNLNIVDINPNVCYWNNASDKLPENKIKKRCINQIFKPGNIKIEHEVFLLGPGGIKHDITDETNLIASTNLYDSYRPTFRFNFDEIAKKTNVNIVPIDPNIKEYTGDAVDITLSTKWNEIDFENPLPNKEVFVEHNTMCKLVQKGRYFILMSLKIDESGTKYYKNEYLLLNDKRC